MSMRKYNGSPIDMTWSNGPWANDGETVDATDGDTGTMTTIDWPEGATPREELNEDEIEVIKTASENQNITTLVGVTHTADIDRSDAYANYVLEKHWPEGKQRIMGRDSNDNTSPVEMVETLRKEALNGSTTYEIAEKYGIGQSTVPQLLKGQRKNVDSNIPPLEHSNGNHGGEWVIATEDGRLPLDHVEKVRSRVLDGEKIYQIAGDYEVGPNEVYKAVVGMEKYESVNAPTPPLESDGSGLDSEWYVPESETEPESDVDQDEAEQTEPETEPTLEGQSVRKGYTPQEPTTTDNTKRNAVIAVVALLISYLLGKRGGN